MMLGTSTSPLGIEETVRLILKTSRGMEGKFIASTRWINSRRQSFCEFSHSRAAIYSYGHRNPQGMVTHPETGEIWTMNTGHEGEMRLTSSKQEKTMDGQLLPMELTIVVHQLQILPKKKDLNSPVPLVAINCTLRYGIPNILRIPQLER